jgi:hypothetical protein
MYPTCLQQIISIKDACNPNPKTLSGYDLSDLPGINVRAASNIADEDYVTGKALLADKLRLAIMEVRTDILQFLQGNEYITQSVSALFRTGELRTGTQDGLIIAQNGNGWRGVSIFNNRPECNLRKLFISEIYIKTDYSGVTTLRIEDGDEYYDYEVTLHAGKIDAIEINFTASKNTVSILLPDNIAVYSVNPNCGCGDKKNDCARVLGIVGPVTTNAEAYGIWADVQCKCDYDYLLCQLATQGLLGQIVLHATGVKIMDEQLKTDRLNYFTIYGEDKAESIKAEWSSIYAEKWNVLIASLPGILQTIDQCGCIECGGSKLVSNV